MYICRLFHRDRPFEQLEARLLAEGRITLGRDPSADWPLGDSDATLSRLHCVLAVEAGRLVLYDKSTNGVFFADDRRAPHDEAVVLSDGDSLRLGALQLVVEEARTTTIDATATVMLSPGWTGPTALPESWREDEPATPGAHRDASLLEAFCEGAGLDASALSSEDPVELMRRVGAIYQQTVIGLSALMADRARIKRESRLERTTISASHNNPFKWTASRKLAEDLLCGREAAFLSDAAAVRASFQDLSLHLSGMLAGAEAAVDLAVQTLDPKAIEAEARSQASLLRPRHAAAWDLMVEHHARLTADELRRAFAAAYEKASEPKATP